MQRSGDFVEDRLIPEGLEGEKVEILSCIRGLHIMRGVGVWVKQSFRDEEIN